MLDRGKARATGIVDVGGEPVIVVTTPVRTDRIVGAVLAAQRVDAVFDDLARRTGATLALYGTDRRLVSESGVGVEPIAPVVGDDPVRKRSRVDNEEIATAYAAGARRHPARDRRHGAPCRHVRLRAGTAVRVIGLVVAGVLAMAGLGIVLSRSLVRTVRRLVETNRALGRGDLSARRGIDSADELGELAEGINSMATQLESSVADLERRVTERTEELRLLSEDLEGALRARSRCSRR